MSSRRMQRLNAQLQREISELLRRQVRDPRVTAVTVTRVSVTPDLSVARVFIRTLNGRDGTAEALEGLNAANAFLRRALSGILTLRRAPELTFMEDRSLEQAMRIEELLTEVRPEGGWVDPVEEEDEEEDDSDESDSDESDSDESDSDDSDDRDGSDESDSDDDEADADDDDDSDIDEGEADDHASESDTDSGDSSDDDDPETPARA